jgi:hypothetical protein
VYHFIRRSHADKNPRVNVVLEKPLYAKVERLAKKDGVSLSLKVRDLVKKRWKWRRTLRWPNSQTLAIRLLAGRKA